jgi:hypothetical protein
MRLRAFMLGAVVLASSIAPASAAMRISEDRGGQIGHYLKAYAMVRSTGERVIVDGNCLSACTLVLGLIPRDRICATNRARFGFHAAWIPDAEGRPVTSALGTRALWDVYPPRVRRWISRHGGLSRHMIYLQGRALSRIVQSCAAMERRAYVRSRRRYSHRPVRYVAGNAASDRR